MSAPLPTPVLCPRCHGRTLTCLHCEGDRFVWAREAITMRRPMVLTPGRGQGDHQRERRLTAPADSDGAKAVANSRGPVAGSQRGTQPAPAVYPRGAKLWPRGER